MEIDSEAVQEQLERMLADPVFKGSRRCKSLLQYLVDVALHGETCPPKERTLGVEVFGRSLDYDTNSDPVVRTTASEIRKRTAQYYHQLAHEAELRIDLPLGSYLPVFHLPELSLTEGLPERGCLPAPLVVHPPLGRRARLRSLVILAAVLLSLCGYGYFRMRTPTSLDSFWSPMLGRWETLSVCIPTVSSETRPNGHPAIVESPLGMPAVSFNENMALVQIIHFLDVKNAQFNVKRLSFDYSEVANPSAAPLTPTLAELRKGPIILLGNSDWSMRLVSPLRFHIRTDNASGIFWIEDRQNPAAKAWSGKIDLPYKDYTRDYAIISRFYDPVTGQTVMALCGLGLHGAAAATEFVTNPYYMSQIAGKNSSEWKKSNVQIVLSTKIAGDSWGPPQILATYFW